MIGAGAVLGLASTHPRQGNYGSQAGYLCTPKVLRFFSAPHLLQLQVQLLEEVIFVTIEIV